MRRFRVFLPVMVVAFLGVTAPGAQPTARAQAATPAAGQSMRTDVRYVLPFGPDGLNPGLTATTTEAGICGFPSSAALDRPDAWDCTGDEGQIYDPCFENPFVAPDDLGQVACLDSPFTTDVVVLNLTAPLVCAWNGFDYDGDLNCCTYEGNRCGFDEACCGTAMCLGGICTSQPSYASPGDPCQTTAQCNRPQTGAICEYTTSTGDSRCCWYEGSLCSSGAQCCGSRVCAGGVCQFPTDGSSGGSGAACTGQGCACQLYREPGCMASCPLYDPCDAGLVCTGTSDVTGICVPSQPSGCTGEGCACYRGLNDADPCDPGLVCCLNQVPVMGGNGGCVPAWQC